METTYKQDVEINPEALDVEWVKQASLYLKYGEQVAKMRDRVDRLKEKLDVQDAELSLKIRQNPASYGLDKVTEGVIKDTILASADHTELANELAETRYELEILQTALRAMDVKKSALENLVRLHGASYFAGPSVPRDLGAEWVKEVERTSARDTIKKKMGVGRK